MRGVAKLRRDTEDTHMCNAGTHMCTVRGHIRHQRGPHLVPLARKARAPRVGLEGTGVWSPNSQSLPHMALTRGPAGRPPVSQTCSGTHPPRPPRASHSAHRGALKLRPRAPAWVRTLWPRGAGIWSTRRGPCVGTPWDGVRRLRDWGDGGGDGAARTQMWRRRRPIQPRRSARDVGSDCDNARRGPDQGGRRPRRAPMVPDVGH